MGTAAYAIDARVSYVDSAGNPTGAAIGVLNPVKLVLETPEPDREIQKSRKRDSFGQALDELVVAKPTGLQFGTDDADDAEVLGWAFNGEAVGYTQSSATVTAEHHPATLGKWLQLNNRAISSLVVKDNATSLITYVAGTDYEVDLVSGQVRPLVGGTITDAEELKFGYTAAALTGKTIKVGSRPVIYVRIDGEGKNLLTGDPVHVLVRRCSLSSVGSLDLVGGKMIVSEMKGTCFIVGSNPAAEITLITP